MDSNESTPTPVTYLSLNPNRMTCARISLAVESAIASLTLYASLKAVSDALSLLQMAKDNVGIPLAPNQQELGTVSRS